MKVRYVVFFGTKTDVEIAQHLHTIIRDTGRRELAKFHKTNIYLESYKRRQASNDFLYGFARRVSQRLIEMKRERDTHIHQETGTALMIFKSSNVQKAFDNLDIKLGGASKVTAGHNDSYSAGVKAGDKMNFHRDFVK